MSKQPKYHVIVPSRNRPKPAARTLSMLPEGALVYVEESEAEAYHKTCGKDKVVTHKSVDRMTIKRNMIVDRWASKVPVVMVDDDLKSVTSLVWKSPHRYLTRESITTIIENGVQALHDSDLGVYCWSRTGNPMLFRGHAPFRFVMYAAGAFIVAPKRAYRFDEKLVLLADIDMSLSALLKDRIILCDVRWYWDFGRTFGNRGGAQDMRQSNQISDDETYIQKKWGKYLKISERSISSARKKDWRKSSGIKGVRIEVVRNAERGLK